MLHKLESDVSACSFIIGLQIAKVNKIAIS